MITETLHKGRHYEAHHIAGPHGGLIVSRRGKRGGVQLRPDHAQYADYLDAIRTALDSDEREALCRALLR